MSHRIKAAIAAGVAVLAVVPAGASAATKTVDMGTPISAQKAFQKAVADVNDFFPHGTTIHVGDSIKFVPTGFHTVDFPAKGGKPLGLIAPAGTTSGVLDAAGAPFWFNGQPMLGFTPALGPPGLYGKKVTYTGAKRVESGAPAGAEAEAVHGQVHQGRHLHVLLQHPLGDEGHGQGRVQEPQRPVGEGRRQDGEGSGLVGAEHGQGPDQDHGRAGQRQHRRLRPAWRRVLRDVPRDPDGPGRARRSSSRCRPRPSRITRRRSAPATPRPSRRATSATWRSTSPRTRCSRRRPSTRAIRRRPVRRP